MSDSIGALFMLLLILSAIVGTLCWLADKGHIQCATCDHVARLHAEFGCSRCACDSFEFPEW